MTLCITVAAMQGVAEQGQPRLLYTYRSQEDIKQHVTGCDADIGGKSSVHLDLGLDGRARLWGDMRLEVPRGKEDTMRSGYAGFRSRVRLLTSDILSFLSSVTSLTVAERGYADTNNIIRAHHG
jgi:hypothetical protein